MKQLFRSINVGFFLAWRQIKRSSWWTTSLIIFVMMLTFLNLVVVSGILVGLIAGSSEAYRGQFSGDVFVTSLPEKEYILESQNIIRRIESYPEVLAVSPRYTVTGLIEANYKSKLRQTDLAEEVTVTITGINPEKENATTNIDELMIEGQFLDAEDQGKIVVGSRLLRRFVRGLPPSFKMIEDLHVGDKVRLRFEGQTKEFTVKGLMGGKIEEVSRRVYLPERELRNWIGRGDLNVQEIAIDLVDSVDPTYITGILKQEGRDEKASFQTWEESQGSFFKDIQRTFDTLGVVIGSIGLLVAIITIFIVVFINAITRRKFIGILKGIGITGTAIEISYVIQSVLYAVFGSALAAALIYGALVPFFEANPIDFPFSDGILVAPLEATLDRFYVLLAATIVAGYIPAKMIIRQNTLDAILGR